MSCYSILNNFIVGTLVVIVCSSHNAFCSHPVQHSRFILLAYIVLLYIISIFSVSKVASAKSFSKNNICMLSQV